MKKSFILSIALTLATSMFAQKTEVTKTEFTDRDFISAVVWPQGISADGSIVWGQVPTSKLVMYNFNNPEDPIYWPEYIGDEDNGMHVAGINFDNRPLIDTFLSTFFLNMEDGSREYIESPDENYGLNTWDITLDGSVIACNLAKSSGEVVPMYGVKQDDGTYKIDYLEYDNYDALGAPAQFTQVRHVTDDGNHLIGIQPDWSGMFGRIVVWDKQADGTYKFNTPLDEYLYDLSCPKPGIAPEYADYVTADPETEPEKYAEQREEFDKIWNEYDTKLMNFTKNFSFVEIYGTKEGTRSDKILMFYIDGNEGNELPLIYDCKNGKITDYKCFGYQARPSENLPGGGNIINDGLEIIAVDDDGNTKPFTDWFKETTNFNMSDLLFGGVPFFSKDGKTLMIEGENYENEAPATLFRFDKDIFDATTTGIKVNVVDAIAVKGGKVTLGNGAEAVADVFAMNGTKCGSYSICGTFDFNEVLPDGAYIISIKSGSDKPVTMKLVVK